MAQRQNEYRTLRTGWFFYACDVLRSFFGEIFSPFTVKIVDEYYGVLTRNAFFSFRFFFFKPRLPFVIYILLRSRKSRRTQYDANGFGRLEFDPVKSPVGSAYKRKHDLDQNFQVNHCCRHSKISRDNKTREKCRLLFQTEFVVFRLFKSRRGVNEKIIRIGSCFCLFVQLEHRVTFVQNNFGCTLQSSGYYICLRLRLCFVKKMQNGPATDVGNTLRPR